MKRELEKTLIEIEGTIKDHEQRGSIHTQSVLEQARGIIEICSKAARTPSGLKEILNRDTARAPREICDEHSYFECPSCNHEGPVEVTVGAGYRTVGYYDQYREEWWTLDEDSILDVIAWKEPSDPYRPERSR